MASISLRLRSIFTYFLVIPLLVLFMGASVAVAKGKEKIVIVEMTPMIDKSVTGVLCGINGSKRQYHCLIDSGASNTLVSDRIVKPEGAVRQLLTGGGTIPVHEHEVSLTLADGFSVRLNAYVQFMMLEDIDVLIGQDLLRQFKSVAFDYARREVVFQR